MLDLEGLRNIVNAPMGCRLSGLQVVGGIAQLVERLVRNEKVSGSNPLTSTTWKKGA
jgi:hypothetical protein